MDASVEEVLMAALHVSTLHCLWIKYLAPSEFCLFGPPASADWC